ncbi:protein spinster-like [Styela clava]
MKSSADWLHHPTLVLMFSYAIGELSHYLLGVISKPMAEEIHFGEMGCMPANNSKSSGLCSNMQGNEILCSNATVNGTQVCIWDYKGDGVDYQLLAGPIFVAIFTIMGIVLGVLGDRYNRIRILFICVLICSTMTLMTGFAKEYWQLAVLRLVFGAAEAGFSPLSASIIADIFGKASRGLGMSIYNWGIYFGFGSAFAVGNLVTKANINNQGWRWAYYISGIPGFFISLVILISLREPNRKNVNINYTNEEYEPILSESMGDQSLESDSGIKKILNVIKVYITMPSFLLLLVAACVRHSASFCFAYNAQLYFTEFYPQTNLGLWMTLSPIIGGTVGIALGGFISDLVVSKYGANTRMWVLATSQLIASPFAFGVLYLDPPFCFFSLIGAYLFAEMWFGILFAVLVELLPTHIRSTCLATFFFVVSNVASLVLLSVPDLKNNMGSREALTLVYPGFYLISSLLFFISQLLLRREHQN